MNNTSKRHTRKTKIAWSLRVARKFLSEGKPSDWGKNPEQICVALFTAHYRTKEITFLQAEAAVAFVMKMLDGAYDVDDWLTENCPEYAKFVSSNVSKCERRRLELQRYRHRWLTHMITELEQA